MKTFLKIYLAIMTLFCLAWFSKPMIESVYSLSAFVVFVFAAIYLFEQYIITWNDRIWLNSNSGCGAVLILLCLFSSLIIVVWKFIPFQHIFNIIIL